VESQLPACRRRIINTHLLTEYAYVLAVGGIVYTITDVEEVAVWMRQKLDEHPLFGTLSESEMEGDTAAAILASATEEGKKVARNKGRTWRACFRRVPAA
jgi:tRNA (guanine-N7-)-methyltransferase